LANETNAPRRRALFLGGCGPCASALRERLCAEPSYEKVFTLAKGRGFSTLLNQVLVERVDEFDAEDVYCVVEPPSTRPVVHASPYPAMVETDVLDVARSVLNAGAQRFIYIRPVASFSQPAVLYGRPQNVMEMELTDLAFNQLFVIRPALFNVAPPSGNFFERIVRGAAEQFKNSLAGQRNSPLTLVRVLDQILAMTLPIGRGVKIIEHGEIRQRHLDLLTLTQ
jgi:hypothetical protein